MKKQGLQKFISVLLFCLIIQFITGKAFAEDTGFKLRFVTKGSNQSQFYYYKGSYQGLISNIGTASNPVYQPEDETIDNASGYSLKIANDLESIQSIRIRDYALDLSGYQFSQEATADDVDHVIFLGQDVSAASATGISSGIIAY